MADITDDAAALRQENERLRDGIAAVVQSLEGEHRLNDDRYGLCRLCVIHDDLEALLAVPAGEAPTPPSEPLMTPEVRERLEAAAERGLAANRLSAEAQKRVQAKADDVQRALGGNQGFAGEPVPPRRMQANALAPDLPHGRSHRIEHDHQEHCDGWSGGFAPCTSVPADSEETP